MSNYNSSSVHSSLNSYGDMYNFSDPQKIGPGVWFMFHVMAAKAETKQEKLFAAKQFKLFCDNFKCGQCQGHCKNYIINNPPENSINHEGLFEWTVDFRNAVNKRLGRHIYDMETMKEIFYKEDFMVCQDGCGQNNAASVTNGARSDPTGFVSQFSPNTDNEDYIELNLDTSGISSFVYPDAVNYGGVNGKRSYYRNNNYRYYNNF